MPLATLSIDLEAKLASLQEGFEKAARLAEKNAQATEAAWKRAGAVMAGIGASVAASFAGFSLVDFVRGNADALDALNDVADATGASIENISALEDLAKRTGTTLDVVTTSLVKLNAALSEAKPDSPIALALKGIGLEAAELRSLDPAEALRRVAQALSGYADDGNKARLVQELFGKSLREVAPLLKDLAEATSLNATTTAAQAAEAEKFNKQLFALQANSAEAARKITSELLPAINGIFDSVKRNGGIWAAFVDGLAQNLNIGRARTLNTELVMAMKQLEAGLSIPENQRTNMQRARIQELREEVAGLMRDAAAVSDSLKARANGGKAPEAMTPQQAWEQARARDRAALDKLSVGELPAAAKPKTAQAEQITEAQRALAAYVKTLEAEFDKTAELTEQQKALNLLKSLGTTGEVPQVRELVLGLAERVEKLKQADELEKAITAELERQANVRRALDEEIDRLAGRAGDARKRALADRLEQQLNAGMTYSPEELEKIVNGIAGITAPVKDKIDELDELTKQFGRNVQDLLGDTLKRSLKGDFDDIGKAWGDLLINMAAQAAALQLGKSLFGDLFKTGELGGGVGSLVDAFNSGGGLAGLVSLLPGFATGGDFGGGLRIVGERGPELEATGPARIFNADQTQQILRGGGGRALQLTYAPVNNFDSRGDRAQMLADAEAINRRGQREMVEMLRARRVI